MADVSMADTTETSMKEVKMKTLNIFSGKRGDLKKFLQTCKMYIQANKKMYDTDEKNVILILSYMDEGNAANWKEQFLDKLEAQAKIAKKDDMDFRTYTDFLELVKKDFSPYDALGDDLEQLKALKFNPKESMINDISRFKNILGQTRITETISTTDHFQQTLPLPLQRKIILLNKLPTTLEEWFKWLSKLTTISKRHRGC